MWLICFAIKDIITVECDLKTDIKIQYDVRFDAIAPTSAHDAASQDVIRLEAQTAFNPGYPLTKRAIYYCSRMISTQHGRYSKSRSTEKSEKCILYGYAQSHLTNFKIRSHGIQFVQNS